MKWQPIETAPRDGTVVDLYCLNGIDDGERWCNAYWKGFGPDDGDGQWVGPWSDGFESGFPSERIKPTHWMLPPEPPR